MPDNDDVFPKTVWRDLPPDHPEYRDCQLLRSFLLAEHAQAKAIFTASCEKNGLQAPAIVTYIAQQFDAYGTAMAMRATDSVSAVKWGHTMDALLEDVLKINAPWFQTVEEGTGISARELMTEVRIRLYTRREHWKAVACRYAMESEFKRATAKRASVDVASSVTTTEVVANFVESNGTGRKRGPKPDHETAARVAETVANVAPNGDWRAKWEEICEALDEARIPCPRTWQRNRRYRTWADCGERDIAVKVIESKLKLAKQRRQPAPETFS
jgi:hypothetical protein